MDTLLAFADEILLFVDSKSSDDHTKREALSLASSVIVNRPQKPTSPRTATGAYTRGPEAPPTASEVAFREEMSTVLEACSKPLESYARAPRS